MPITPSAVIKPNAPDDDGNWAIALLTEGSFNQGGTTVSIYKDSLNKEAAWAYLKYTYFSEEGAAIVMIGLMLPTQISVIGYVMEMWTAHLTNTLWSVICVWIANPFSAFFHNAVSARTRLYSAKTRLSVDKNCGKGYS